MQPEKLANIVEAENSKQAQPLMGNKGKGPLGRKAICNHIKAAIKSGDLDSE